MRHYLFIGIAMGAAFAVTTQGQTQPPSPPSGPLLRPAPDYAQWTVTFKFPGKSNANVPAASAETDEESNEVRQVTVTKTKPIWHAVTLGKNGVIFDGWGNGSVTYMISPKEKEASELNRNTDTGEFEIQNKFSVGYEKRDFPDMEWVSAKTYKGSINQDSVLIFQNSDGKGETVYIDARTRLPIRWQKEGEVRDYRFMDPPPAMLKLPAQVNTTIESAKKIYDSSMWPPPKNKP